MAWVLPLVQASAKGRLMSGNANVDSEVARPAMHEEESRMFSTLSFIDKWKQLCRVLRYRKGFGRLHSMRYALWLARG